MLTESSARKVSSEPLCPKVVFRLGGASIRGFFASLKLTGAPRAGTFSFAETIWRRMRSRSPCSIQPRQGIFVLLKGMALAMPPKLSRHRGFSRWGTFFQWLYEAYRRGQSPMEYQLPTARLKPCP